MYDTSLSRQIAMQIRKEMEQIQHWTNQTLRALIADDDDDDDESLPLH
jgi:hypothetical protein